MGQVGAVVEFGRERFGHFWGAVRFSFVWSDRVSRRWVRWLTSWTWMDDAPLTPSILRSLSLRTSAVLSLSTLLHLRHCTMMLFEAMVP